MPVSIEKRAGKYRIVEPGRHGENKKVALTETGRAHDGGGHASYSDALAQLRTINRDLARKGERVVGPR